jgi:hypothetical protein
VLVEAEPGAVIIVAAWMLEAAICATMQLGTPHVSVEALADLHRRLTELGLRRSSPDDATVVQITDTTREALSAWLKLRGPREDDWL